MLKSWTAQRTHSVASGSTLLPTYSNCLALLQRVHTAVGLRLTRLAINYKTTRRAPTLIMSGALLPHTARSVSGSNCTGIYKYACLAISDFNCYFKSNIYIQFAYHESSDHQSCKNLPPDYSSVNKPVIDNKNIFQIGTMMFKIYCILRRSR